MSTVTPEQTASSIKTRFLILSDTHSHTPSQKTGSSNVVSPRPLPKADVLLHCGDLTMIGHLHEYEKTIDMLESIDADLKLVIAGNHDITLDKTYYERKGLSMHNRRGYDENLPTKARELWLGDRARSAGITYLEEGIHSFTLKNGAKLCVRYLARTCSW
jgi:predicted MPP superfamily phosphohydrolase